MMLANWQDIRSDCDIVVPKHRVITINITNSVAIGMRRCNSALVLAAQRQPAAGMACAMCNNGGEASSRHSRKKTPEQTK